MTGHPTPLGQGYRASVSRVHAAVGVLVNVVFAGLLLGGCGGPPTGSGDPGNVRLHMLRADPVFRTLPPQSHLLMPIKLEPAQWTQPPFQTGGWNGADVVMVFHSDQSVAQVAAFYNARAQAAGWRLDGFDNGMPASWSKYYPGRISADLTFSYGSEVAASDTYGRKGTYELAGSISPKWG